MAYIDELFRMALEKKASDIHLIANHLPTYRVEGVLHKIEDESLRLTPKPLSQLILEILLPSQKELLTKNRSLNFAYQLDEIRFRVQVYFQNGQLSLSARHIRSQIPTFDQLNFPESFKQLSQLQRGLVLVTGPSSSGKTSAISSIINNIHQNQARHIMTLEDPVEYVYGKGQSLIQQREIGSDSLTMLDAVNDVVRQDTNILFVGNIRDIDVLKAVLQVAEAGNLVFTTMKSFSVLHALEQLFLMAPSEYHTQLQHQLAHVLKCVISQDLIQSQANGRLALREYIFINNEIQKLLKVKDFNAINSYLQNEEYTESQSFELAAKRFLDQSLISQETYESILEAKTQIV